MSNTKSEALKDVLGGPANFELTAEDLCTTYRVQFPVLRMYERETCYDQRGMVIFTTNRGLSGVGLPRKVWEEIKHAKPGDELPEYATENVPPFTRCDREEDMTLAYEVFQKRLAASAIGGTIS